MQKDLKASFALWLKIVHVKYAAAQFLLFAVAEFMVIAFAAPRFYGRVRELFLTVNMDADSGILVLSAIYIVVFSIAMKQIVYQAHERNQDLFYQLAVSKRAGCTCTIFQQLGWHYFSVVVLSVICGNSIVLGYCVILADTLLFFLIFRIYYNKADIGICKRKKLLFGLDIHAWIRGKGNKSRSGNRNKNGSKDSDKSKSGNRSGSKRENLLKKHPLWELFKITIHGFYQCKSLVVSKMVLLLFIILCGSAHMLRGSVFLLADGLLILFNDGYWKKESPNFLYFSNIGIPVSKYLCVHFISGISFNIFISVLLFYGMTGEMGAAAASLVLLVYFLVFWYLVQFYLRLVIGRDMDAAVMLCSMGFLLIALLPPAGLAVMVWLYKRIAHQWEREGCLR